MKTLYLLRHAKSSWDDPSLADHDRPLAPRGRRAAAQMAAHMRRAKVRPDLVLCSSAARAVQTYELIATALRPSTEVLVEDDVYEASDTDLLIRLQDVPDEVRATLVVGHNPGLQDLALSLAGDGDTPGLAQMGDKFPTAGLATLNVPTPWSALGSGHAYLASIVTPRDL